MANFIKEITERRVLPAVGVYVAGCWLLVEILDRTVERYLLSPYITDAVFWGLFSLIPAVLLVAWSYGRPGKDKATTAQKVGVPINLIATAGLLVTLFGDKDFSAAADLVTVANEEGQTESHYVANENYRRRIALFFFDNKSGDPELDWLQYGITNLLSQDLQQDPFIAVIDPWVNWGLGMYLQMRSAGFETGLDLPRSLKKRIADKANRQHFVDGEITRESGEFLLTARIWDTRTLAKVSDVSARGWDVLELADQVSDDIRKVLEVPGSGSRDATMPLSETYGESEEAFRLHLEALNTRLFHNDLPGADALFDQAIAADPGFVLAWYEKAINLFESGDLPAAQTALQKVRELDYRLSERDRSMVKQIGYRLAGETEKVIALLRLQVQLRGDSAAHNRLATMLMITGQLNEAKQEFLAALEKDPLNTGIYLNLSIIERGLGKLQGSLEFAQRFLEEKPEDSGALIMVGDLLRDTGVLDRASQQYEKAQLLGDDPVPPMLKLAELAARNGDTSGAREILDQAKALADSPLTRTQVLAAEAQLEYRLGKVRAAIQAINDEYEHAIQALPPVAVAVAVFDPLVRSYVDIGEYERATDALAQGKSLLQPPMDQFLSFTEAQLLIAMGELEAAEEAIRSGDAIIEQFDFDALRFLPALVKGVLASRRGDFAQAAEMHALAVTSVRHSIMSSEFYIFMPMFLAELANVQIKAGQLEKADATLSEGMQLDPNQPLLWLAKARYQEAMGQGLLAAASVQYALAIWADADPEYVYYDMARRLADRIAGSNKQAAVIP